MVGSLLYGGSFIAMRWLVYCFVCSLFCSDGWFWWVHCFVVVGLLLCSGWFIALWWFVHCYAVVGLLFCLFIVL